MWLSSAISKTLRTGVGSPPTSFSLISAPLSRTCIICWIVVLMSFAPLVEYTGITSGKTTQQSIHNDSTKRHKDRFPIFFPLIPRYLRRSVRCRMRRYPGRERVAASLARPSACSSSNAQTFPKWNGGCWDDPWGVSKGTWKRWGIYMNLRRNSTGNLSEQQKLEIYELYNSTKIELNSWGGQEFTDNNRGAAQAQYETPTWAGKQGEKLCDNNNFQVECRRTRDSLLPGFQQRDPCIEQ